MPADPQTSSLTERILRQDRRLLIALLTLLFGISALYTVLGVGMNMTALEMTAMSGMRDMPGGTDPGAWSAHYLILVFLMWWAMMVAMMLPSVAPTALLYGQLMRRSQVGRDRAKLQVMAFVGGYLLSWGAFSLAATVAHWGGETLGVVSATMMTFIHTGPGGLLLICAGLFQFSGLKERCLQYCQSPVAILTRFFRPGPYGALQLGLRHGVYCLGCCWALMVLLFVGGVMNLYWITALAAYVALEKLTPFGRQVSKLAGVALIFWGGFVLLS
ncbi:DUF2182 domain-containing protein [Epibacterium ulvae]|uniref:DUF2182 domain-containing protein n=1 Tax=Epibacterium ulvae TaxID=1156985 RepID=UPI001BFC9899|nr:DUF2182 domain-containing protein [Epibacterium ulvae]MBT8152599.1 DUF2182 domain-containing protein [Epibacterium ulvae]